MFQCWRRWADVGPAAVPVPGVAYSGPGGRGGEGQTQRAHEDRTRKVRNIAISWSVC